MASRGQAVTLTYVAWDSAANAGKTGDVLNHTLRWVKDGVSAAPTNAPAEVDATNAPGIYKITLTAAECTCDFGTLGGKSATAGVRIIPVSAGFEQLPTAAAGAAGGLPTVDASNRIAGIQGTKNTLDALNDVTAAAVRAEMDANSADLNAIVLYVDELESRLTAARALLLDNLANLDAAVSSRSTLTAAAVNAEVDQALIDIRLDELLAADSDIDGLTPPAVGSVVFELLTKDPAAFAFDQTTDSLEAIRDRGDAAWSGTGLSQQQVRDAMALAPSAGVPAAGSVDKHLDDVQAQTDRLAFDAGRVIAQGFPAGS